MALPNYQYFLLPVLKILAQKDRTNLHEVRREIIKKEKFSQEDVEEQLTTGQTRLANRIGWAALDLKKAELVHQPKRGVYCISESGLKYLADNPKMENLNNKDLAEISSGFRKWRRQLRKKKGQTSENIPSKEEYIVDPAETGTVEEDLEEAYNKLQRLLAEDLKERLRNNSPEFLESTALKLLGAMGYGTGKRTGGPKDRGIDGIVLTDVLGIKKIATQTKRIQRKVPVEDIEKFLGGLDGIGINDGVFITTSDFTKDAVDFVEKKRGYKSIKLINGDELAELMIKYNIGVSKKFKYIIKQIDEDFFVEE